MEISYWQSRWRNDKTGWHMQQIYPHLIEFWHKLNLDTNSYVLVPLCGKSLDMYWLAEQGHRVIGVEVSEIAIQQVVNESQLDFQTASKGPYTIYSSGSLELWLGDVFKLQPGYLPQIDAVYDKAALIALPEDKRKRYANLMQQLCSDHTRIFLNTLEYEQAEMTGPPFSVTLEELETLYGNRFDIRLLYEASLLDDLTKFKQRGLNSYLTEKLYHLVPC